LLVQERSWTLAEPSIAVYSVLVSGRARNEWNFGLEMHGGLRTQGWLLQRCLGFYR